MPGTSASTILAGNINCALGLGVLLAEAVAVDDTNAAIAVGETEPVACAVWLAASTELDVEGLGLPWELAPVLGEEEAFP